MKATARLLPCRQLADGSAADDCRPAPDIVAPLVGSAAALQEIAEDALRNPDSEACGYQWRRFAITTTGYMRFKEGEVFYVYADGQRMPGVIWQVRIEQSGQMQLRQSLQILVPADDGR